MTADKVAKRLEAFKEEFGTAQELGLKYRLPLWRLTVGRRSESLRR